MSANVNTGAGNGGSSAGVSAARAANVDAALTQRPASKCFMDIGLSSETQDSWSHAKWNSLYRTGESGNQSLRADQSIGITQNAMQSRPLALQEHRTER